MGERLDRWVEWVAKVNRRSRERNEALRRLHDVCPDDHRGAVTREADRRWARRRLRGQRPRLADIYDEIRAEVEAGTWVPPKRRPFRFADDDDTAW